MASPLQTEILAAIDKVQRYGLPLTPENVRANVSTDHLTMGDATEALRKQLVREIPIVLKSEGHAIIDVKTRERKKWWACVADEIEADLRIKEESSRFDRPHIEAERAVVRFLRAKAQELGYDPHPDLFHGDIDRIYQMHGLAAPAA